jgi:predicted nucleic acid-binding Zn finger protein
MTMIDTQDSRLGKAMQLVEDAGQWLRIYTRDRRPFAFGVPSQRDPNVRYVVTLSSCQCADFKRHGTPCKHITAVALYVARKKAEKALRRKGASKAA